jgi:MarR family transcriptional regulator, organic hydroperoxide resistance regulator
MDTGTAIRARRKSKPTPFRFGGTRTASLAGQRVPAIGMGRLLREADMTFNRALREELARHDVTFSQYQHLWQLWKEDGLPQFELSRRIGIETASSTSVIDQLERRGFITRRRDAADRRRIVVSLTPAGKKLEAPLDACAIAINRRARSLLSNREITALYDTMRKVIAGLHCK